MLEVYSQCCKNCLLSKNRIVSPKRSKEIVSDCSKKQTYLICHKSDKIVCKTFYDRLGHVSQLIRIAQRLNAVKFVDQEDSKKLITYDEMNNRFKK